MRFQTKLLSVLIGACLGSGGVVHAAQLGKLSVVSKPDQVFAAEVLIERILPGERDTLRVGLANAESFAAARLTMDPNLSKLRFSIKDGPTPGTALVVVTASEPLPAGFMDALLELSWAGGKVTREYTLSIPIQAKPPTVVPALPQLKAPVTDAAKVPAPVAAEPKAPAKPTAKPEPKAEAKVEPKPAAKPDPAQPAAKTAEPAAEKQVDKPVEASKPEVAAKPAAPERKRKVRRGDTLSAIALDMVGDGVTLNQAMAAIFEANPDAFIQGSIHRLKPGAELSLPNRTAMKARSRDEAFVVLAKADDRNDFAAVAKAKGLLTVAQQDTAATKPSGGQIESKPAKNANAGSGQDTLRISPGGADPDAKAKLDKAAEELTAKEKALAEANERIALLEKNVSDLQKLLDMQQQAAKATAGTPTAPAGASQVPAEPAAADATPPASTESAAEAPPPAEPTPVAPTIEVEKPPVAVAPEPKVEPKPQVSEGLLSNLWVLGGVGGAGLGVAAAMLLLLKRRRQAAQAPLTTAEDTSQSAETFSEALAWASANADGDTEPSKAEPVSLAERVEDEVFDLDEVLNETPAPTPAVTAAPAQVVPQAVAETPASASDLPPSPALDLDFATNAPDNQAEVNSIFDDLDTLEKGAEDVKRELEALKQAGAAEAPSEDEVAAAFDDLVQDTEPAESAKVEESKAEDLSDAFDQAMSELDLDLPGQEVDQATWQEVATKLDLAGAYVEIGDADGASELLKEIMEKGDASQVKKAKELLASLK